MIESHSLNDLEPQVQLENSNNRRESISLASNTLEDHEPASCSRSQLSTHRIPLLPWKRSASPSSGIIDRLDKLVDLGKAGADRGRWPTPLHCLLHAVPLAITVVILCLNFAGFYWQDLGYPNQNAILQGFQYVAKAQELMMVTSLTAVVMHRLQHDLSISGGVPFGFLTAGFKLGEPQYILSKEFLGGATAPVYPKGLSRYLPTGYLIVLVIGQSSVVGPSTAVSMIPRLSWWDVSRAKAFGSTFHDRIYLNRTEHELWPTEITNDIYADLDKCKLSQSINEDCAVKAMDIVGPWVSRHQNQGTKPNITIFQEGEVMRYLTSKGGPPDDSSWTVTSTVPFFLARDLIHYWDWLVENSTLPTNLGRPLLRPTFVNKKLKAKKPLVQAQCHTYLQPDWEHGSFEFPHDKLLTPPLDKFKHNTWKLRNEFVLNFKGNTSNPWMFDWVDTASEFASAGAPSLGGVLIYSAFNGSDDLDALAICSFDGRWVPVEYFLDPKDVNTILQDSPDPMNILNGTNRVAVKDMSRMKMSLDWAKSINVAAPGDDPAATTIERILENWGGSSMIPENRPKPGYNMTSLDWRISTTLGLYLTEGLARAFQDGDKGSMLYRQAHDIDQSYVRYLDNINKPGPKEGYKDGKLDWVEKQDPRWNSSIPPWDVWAPQNGYTEITVSVQRYGYGYGFEGVPIKLATTVLMVYSVFISIYILVLFRSGRGYRGCGDIAEMLALAWNSAPVEELKDTSDGIEQLSTWRQVVKIRESEGLQRQFVIEKGGSSGLRRRNVRMGTYAWLDG